MVFLKPVSWESTIPHLHETQNVFSPSPGNSRMKAAWTQRSWMPPATKLRESQWRTQHFTSKIPKSCPEFLGHKKHVLRFFLIYNNFWPWNNVSCFQTTVSALGLLVSSDSKKHAECEALQPTSEPLICKQEKNKIKQSKRWIRTLTSDVSLTR